MFSTFLCVGLNFQARVGLIRSLSNLDYPIKQHNTIFERMSKSQDVEKKEHETWQKCDDDIYSKRIWNLYLPIDYQVDQISVEFVTKVRRKRNLSMLTKTRFNRCKLLKPDCHPNCLTKKKKKKKDCHPNNLLDYSKASRVEFFTKRK